jgi:dephospho-CoA kinase
MKRRRIGIAGFMGAGKTTFAKILSELLPRAKVINADRNAKRLMQTDTGIKKNILTAFGSPVVTEGVIDFKRLGAAVFNTRENILALNHIVHPLLLETLEEQVFSNDACVICDAALIPLWRIESWFDTLVWVRADFNVRLARLLKKSSLSPKALVCRMQIQQALFSEPTKAPWSVVENNGAIEELLSQTQSDRALLGEYSDCGDTPVTS